jgi:flagellar hook-basal body complex protein FliE
MDLKLQPFDFAQAAARAGMPQVAAKVQAQTQAASPASFQSAFTSALRSVSQSQMQAEQMQQQVALGNPSVSLEQTMVAMQKAQIGFQSAVQVRNRLVQAYTDIMNMQV